MLAPPHPPLTVTGLLVRVLEEWECAVPLAGRLGCFLRDSSNCSIFCMVSSASALLLAVAWVSLAVWMPGELCALFTSEGGVRGFSLVYSKLRLS